MFTRSQRVDGKVGTGAEIVAAVFPTNCDTIFTLGLRVKNSIFREDWFAAYIFEPEILNAAEFFPQRNLPLLKIHPLRFSQM
jgi:hypothetical protein